MNKVKRKKRTKEFTRLKRSFNKERMSEIERGFMLDYSSNLILMALVDEFEYREMIVFPFQDVKKIRFNKSDQFYDKILRKEKVFKKIDRKENLNIQDWKSFFESIKNDFIFVETENAKNRTFHIGGILKVSKNKIRFLYFDSTGKVNDEPYNIKFKHITRVSIDSNYSKVFQKYVYQ